MADETLARQTRKAGTGWVVGQIIDHWIEITIAIVAAASGVLAVVTKWLAAYGPIAWGAAVIIGGLAAALICWIFMRAKLLSATADYNRAMATVPVTVNPLRSTFENERVRISDFFSPQYIPRTGKTFRNCEIFGPGAILLMDHSTMRDVHFHQCDLVALEDRTPLFTAVGLTRTTIEDCRLFNVTVFIPRSVAEKLIEEAATEGRPPMLVIGLQPKK